MTNKNRLALIALHLTSQIGPARFRALLNHFGSADAVIGASEAELCRVPDIGKKIALEIRGSLSLEKAEEEIKRADGFGAQIITLEDDEYPQLLKEIYSPPLLLYKTGQPLRADEVCVAIVGSRQCSDYGRRIAAGFGRDLSARGFSIVSGLARGIDTAAQEAVVEQGGRTIAVLGSGIDQLYPKENKRLFEKIQEQGCVLSEFPMNTPALPEHFPRRNRILSGLSLGVLLVEAGEKSGACITANWALEQGRHVFAVPGPVDKPFSRGCHDMIRNGAKLVEKTEQILEDLPNFQTETKESKTVKKAPSPIPSLPDAEDRLYKLISDEPAHIDDLARRGEYEQSTLHTLLLKLQMKGLLRQLPGMYFSKIS